MSIGTDFDYLDLDHLDCDHIESGKHKIRVFGVLVLAVPPLVLPLTALYDHRLARISKCW